MVKTKVKALTTVRDDGKTHAAGETFEMEISLVKPHVDAGQVELVESPETDATGATEKASGTPADKQARPGKDK